MIANAALARQHQRWKEARERMKPAPKVVTLIHQPAPAPVTREMAEPDPAPEPVAKPRKPLKHGTSWIAPRFVYRSPIGPLKPPSDERVVGMPTPDAGRRLVWEIGEAFGLFEAELRGKSRAGRVCIARHWLAWKLYKEEGWPCTKIGRFLGDRDHSTIIHSIKKHEQRWAIARALGVTEPAAFMDHFLREFTENQRKGAKAANASAKKSRDARMAGKAASMRAKLRGRG